MRRSLGRAFLLGLAAGLAAALWRSSTRRSRPTAPSSIRSAEPDQAPSAGPTTVPPVDHAPPHDDPTPEPPTDPGRADEAPPSDTAEPVPDGGGTGEPAWKEPEEGTCPDGYPVKAKESSGIFHVPGGLSYDRTRPDRCYRSPADAEADDFRPAKR